MPKPRRPQPLIIRLTHWVNVPVLAVMAMSGLEILRAYPTFGPRGDRWAWVPLEGWVAPDWMRAGQWLAGARHLHFLFAWILVLNALAFFAYVAWRGEHRRRFWWPPRDARPLGQQLLHVARLREAPPVQPPGALYNPLQRLAYTGVWLLGVLEVLSGLAMWKPVQLHGLAWLMGGYDGARVVHFLALLGLLAFVVGHIIMVALRPRALVAMVTGGRRAPAPDEEAT